MKKIRICNWYSSTIIDKEQLKTLKLTFPDRITWKKKRLADQTLHHFPIFNTIPQCLDYRIVKIVLD